MFRMITASFIVLAAGALSAAACRPLLPPAVSWQPRTAQGYPPPTPPTPPPGATASPGPDPDGYLPPPAEPDGQIVRLADSPYADVLVGLQAALDGGHGAWFAERVGERLGLGMFDIGQLDSEGRTVLDAAEAGAVAAAFFAAGARPRIQAYFVDERWTITCLDALTHRWQGDVPYPGVDDLGGGEPIGPQPPASVPLDAAALRLCRDQLGRWTLDEWVHGGYYGMIAQIHALHGDRPLFIVRP